MGVNLSPRGGGVFQRLRRLILSDSRVAIVELIANAWDAGATRVDIKWPYGTSDYELAISDNGTGMTRNEFDKRWRTLNYNRQEEQGDMVTFPPDNGSESQRYA